LAPQVLGPVLGGVLAAGFNWRAIFWFLAIFSGIACIFFLIFFNDTFRPERSLTYQNIVMKRLKENDQAMRGLHDVEAVGLSSETDASSEKHSSHDCTSNEAAHATIPPVQLSLRDVNPVKPLALVLGRQNNIVIFLGSGKPPGTKPRTNNIYI
jgi:MFS family permease